MESGYIEEIRREQMNNKEAIEVLKIKKAEFETDAWLQSDIKTLEKLQGDIKALEKGIKALENQKSIVEELEKIKAEIHKLAFDDEDGDYLTLIDDDEAMELIDKQIAELKGEDK